jgi:hypothetical protein
MRVGDIGTIEDGILTKTGTLKDYGIAFSEEVSPQSVDIDYATAGAVSIKFKAAGSAPVTGHLPAKVDGEIEVMFDRAEAILFQASTCTTRELKNIKQVSDKIISLFNAAEWRKNQVVITDVVHCASSTIVISSDAKAQLTLGVKGDVGSGKAQLASVNASFTFKDEKAIATRFVGEKELTPLFRARGIKTPLLPWNDPTIVVRKGPNDLILDNLNYPQILEVSPGGERDG